MASQIQNAAPRYFRISFWCVLFGLPVLAVALLVGSNTADDEVKGPWKIRAKRQTNIQDAYTKKLWVLDFRCKYPRLITVNVPGRGKKLCWYLIYQVINNTGEPRTLIPDFEWVTNDRKTRHHDQILPKVQEAIAALEDPTGYYQLKNSVTIAAEPIPPSLPRAVPRPVTGVAIWDDINPDANYFSIFVKGLSNGWAVTDPVVKGGNPVVRRKTLQLKFRRLGDRYFQKASEIRFLSPAEWKYRGSELNVPGLPRAKSD